MAARPAGLKPKRVARVGGAETEVFIDTSGFFALMSAADPAHSFAREQMAHFAYARRRAVTTDHVLDETFILLKVRGSVHRCPSFQQMLDTSRSLRVNWTEPPVFATASALFLNRLDQGFSLTDCISFVVMEREGLREALTTDHHFQIAGFVPLLLQTR